MVVLIWIKYGGYAPTNKQHEKSRHVSHVLFYCGLFIPKLGFPLKCIQVKLIGMLNVVTTIIVLPNNLYKIF